MGNEHAIVVMNHSFEVDWLMGWLVCEQSRLLAVNFIVKVRCKLFKMSFISVRNF